MNNNINEMLAELKDNQGVNSFEKELEILKKVAYDNTIKIYEEAYKGLIREYIINPVLNKDLVYMAYLKCSDGHIDYKLADYTLNNPISYLIHAYNGLNYMPIYMFENYGSKYNGMIFDTGRLEELLKEDGISIFIKNDTLLYICATPQVFKKLIENSTKTKKR